MGQEEWKLLRDHCSRSRYENSFCIRRPNKGRRFFRLCGLANVVFEPSGDNSTGDSRARPITPIITKYYGLLMGRYFTTRDSRFQSCSKFFFRPIKLTLNRVSWATFDFDFDLLQKGGIVFEKESSCFGTLDGWKGREEKKKRKIWGRAWNVGRPMSRAVRYWVNCDETNDAEIFLRIHRSLEIDGIPSVSVFPLVR